MSYRIKGQYAKGYLSSLESCSGMGGIEATWTTDKGAGPPINFDTRLDAVSVARIWGNRWKDIVKVVKMKSPKKWPS